MFPGSAQDFYFCFKIPQNIFPRSAQDVDFKIPHPNFIFQTILLPSYSYDGPVWTWPDWGFKLNNFVLFF